MEEALADFRVWGKALDGTLSFQLVIASGPVLVILSNLKLLSANGALVRWLCTAVVLVALVEIVYLGALIFIVLDLMAFISIPEALELATSEQKLERIKLFGRELFEFDVGIRAYRMLVPLFTYSATVLAFLACFWRQEHA